MSASERKERMQKWIKFIKENPSEQDIKSAAETEIKWIMNQIGRGGKRITMATVRKNITEYRKKIKNLIPMHIADLEKKLTEKWRDMVSVLNSMELDAEEYQKQKAEIEKFPIIVELKNTLEQFENKNATYKAISHAMKHLITPQDIQDAIQAGQRNKMNKKLENQNPLNENRYIEKCHELLLKDGIDCIVGICGLTGRREQEVMSKGIISEFKAETDHWTVLFKGQLKTRDSRLANNGYRIPVLADPNEIKSKLTAAREMIEPDTSWTAEKARESVRKHFHDILPPPIDVKLLRSAYATICSNRYRPEEVGKDAYINQILGHAKGDNRAGMHYKIFQEPKGS